ncbi:MAG: hypothetical protein WD801_15395 [Gemmatimonadaceae bacterium]
MRLYLAVVAGILLLPAGAAAQARVTVIDAGPGSSGRILRTATALPHRLVEPDTGWFILGRDSTQRTTLIVLGRSAAIASRVDGDVIVVGGDLYVRPGAHITGRGVAIGGGTYPSTLAVVEQGTLSFRDNTFSIAPGPGGYTLAYQSLREHASPPLLFPGAYGLRMPRYDRVNGVSIPFGPSLTVASGRGELDALVTYRSDLGQFDPSVEGGVQFSRRLRAQAAVGRGTLSNDAWIWSNLVNSFSALVFGKDTRNYYRADRAELTVHRLWETVSAQIEPFIGAMAERAWSIGPSVGSQHGPWSLFGRADSLGMRRPNPPIQPGDIASALAGGTVLWEAQDVRVRLRSRGEIALAAPADQRFQQATTDLDVSFPTVREQEYALEVHWVTTFGDTPPPQRFSWLGGSGTLPFLDLLEQGGDEALLIEQRYSVPVPRIRVGFLGEPTLQFRHRLGSAGIGRLPTLEQVIGVGVMLALVRGEIQLDPARGETRFSVGFSFSR